MGTNYYLIYNHCDCCGRHDKQHIGKSSMGWKFLFHGYRLPPWFNMDLDEHWYRTEGKASVIDTFAEWRKRIDADGARIEDEYGRPIEKAVFYEMVEEKQASGKTQADLEQHNYSDPYRPQSWLDRDGYQFYDADFS